MLETVLLILPVIIFISYVVSVARIRMKHRDKFPELESVPSPFIGSIKQMSLLFGLIFNKKLTLLGYPLLTLATYVCFISVIVFVPLMIAYALR